MPSFARSLLTALALSVGGIACGGSASPPAGSAPVVTASVASVALPPPLPPVADVPSATPVAAASCPTACPGRAGPALVSAISLRARQAHRCYSSALGVDGALRGKVTVHLTIRADGTICEASAAAEDKPMEAVASCVAGTYRARDLQLPPPDNGCVAVNLPISFVPRPEDAGAP